MDDPPRTSVPRPVHEHQIRSQHQRVVRAVFLLQVHLRLHELLQTLLAREQLLLPALLAWPAKNLLVFAGLLFVFVLPAAAATLSDHFPPARNPWDPDRTPGGSSGGSAAAAVDRRLRTGRAAGGPWGGPSRRN